MRNIIIEDEKGNKIEKHEIHFKSFLPRIGEKISIVRYVEGNVKIIDGQRTGVEYFSIVDKVDNYKVIDIEHIIYPCCNGMTQIDIKITVSLVLDLLKRELKELTSGLYYQGTAGEGA